MKKTLLTLALIAVLAEVAGTKPFIVTKFIPAQLGNQMFQVAAAVSLAIDNDADALFPEFMTQKKYGFPYNYKKIFYKLNVAKPSRAVVFKYVAPHYQFKEIPYTPDMRISGWFQSEKYFKHNKEAIVDLFSPDASMLKKIKKQYKKLLSYSNKVAVHIRTYKHEDPKENGHIHNVFELNGRSYVKKAIKLFSDKSTFLIFSDDIPWCKKELAGIKAKMVFVEANQYLHEFYLMSLCDHNIISNSTFSWWAAYLNRNPDKKVVAPKRWFKQTAWLNSKDLIPEEWTVVD